MKATFAYTGLRVKDLEPSVAFYTKMFGMKETGRTKIAPSRGEAVQLVSEDDGPVLELNHYAEGSRFGPKYVAGEGLDHLAFRVDDLDAFLAEAKKAGHSTTLEMRSGESRWAYIEDPNGLWIELFA